MVMFGPDGHGRLGRVLPCIGLDLHSIELVPSDLLQGLVIEVYLGELVSRDLNVDDQCRYNIREGQKHALLLLQVLVLDFQLVLDLLFGALCCHALQVCLALHQFEYCFLVVSHPTLD